MPVRPRSVPDKVSDWLAAYRAIQSELTPQAFRDITALASADNAVAIQQGMVAAKVVFANDRAAAYVAALLTANGVKPMPISFGESEE